MEKDAKTLKRYLTVDSVIQLLSRPIPRRYLSAMMVLGVLLASSFLGQRASMRWLLLLAVSFGMVVLLRVPQLGLLAVIIAALNVGVEISTGTEIKLNFATLLVPALFVLWLLKGLRARELHWAASAANRPFILFLLASLLSFLIGNATWPPAVPRSDDFWLVQLAQCAIFVIAALAFWLVANVHELETWLPRLTWTFLYVGGGLASVWMAFGSSRWLSTITTFTFQRAPFWILLTALAGGQLLFNAELGRVRQVYLLVVMIAVLIYAFVRVDDRTSNWVGVSAVAGVLVWLRLPHLRRTIIILGGLLLVLGLVSGTLYEFAGGSEKWDESGASRLVLIERVVSVTLRNPITGLGPASYRNYAGMSPLIYQRALWFHPKINSHNNYIDLFAHVGLLGLGLFLWFAVELFLLGLRLNERYQTGFIGGYVGGMTAAWVGSLVIMMLADWMLPFVYNIGYPGFQASLLVWLFLGGLVAIENMNNAEKC
ncbi:MAG: O-antigen ligase family protein [Anaerolineae bacterium]|nr:O-antigen ligase family protein [Anaerolineae bacterium]